MAMSDLVAWLGQILAEDEAYASQIGAPDGYYPDPYDPGSPLRHEALLADIAAKRAILALHQPDRGADTWYWRERECAECGHRWHGTTPIGTPPTVIGPETGCPTVRLLASAYADRTGYRDEWKP